MARGIWRKRDGWATEDSVWVEYGDLPAMEVPLSYYRIQGYLPDPDRLPDWDDLPPEDRPGETS